VPRADKGTDNAWFHLLPNFLGTRIKSRQDGDALDDFDFGFATVMPCLPATGNMNPLADSDFLLDGFCPL
jgi:hypothetical protein